METFDPRIDAYIGKAQPFAQPILTYLREVVHKACPEAQETIKWGMPFFDYKGTLCHIASFKQHAIFGFWKGALLSDKEGRIVRGEGENAAMGHFGKITSVNELPKERIIIAYLKEAMKLNEDGIKVAAKAKGAAKPEIPEPDEVKKALKANAAVKKKWAAFAPSHRCEYLEWITEAKTEATRQKRIDTMIEWVGEGRQRHWKYQK